ncbi:MAG: zinc ribbon domain-containing protein [Treponema sp.]|nr:zinc ribbon domain-containing protein [Treponema sp.]
MFGLSKKSPGKEGRSYKFLCENCGADVPRDAKTCPKCKSSFSNIRCPFCEFVGEEQLFIEGCPTCGHRISGLGEDEPQKQGRPARTPRKSRQAHQYTHGPLPLWVYILTTAAFTATLAALFLRLIR